MGFSSIVNHNFRQSVRTSLMNKSNKSEKNSSTDLRATIFIVIAKLFKEKVGVKTTSSAGGSKKL